MKTRRTFLKVRLSQAVSWSFIEAKPGVLKLQFLQPLDLIKLQAAVFPTPPVIRHLGHPDLPDRVGNHRSLRDLTGIF